MPDKKKRDARTMTYRERDRERANLHNRIEAIGRTMVSLLVTKLGPASDDSDVNLINIDPPMCRKAWADIQAADERLTELLQADAEMMRNLAQIDPDKVDETLKEVCHAV